MTISTISFNNASRAVIQKVQADLRDALTESSTNRHADVGRTLGRLTGNAVTLRSQETSLDRTLTTNKLVTQRFELMDDTLDAVTKGVETLAANLVTGLGNADFLRSARQLAASGIEQMTGALNISSGGQYLFAGTQTDVRPLIAYEGEGNGDPAAPGPKAAVQASYAAFLAAAGRTPATVTKDELAAYLSTGFAELDANGAPVLDANGQAVVHRMSDVFADPSWGQSFSSASSDVITARISKSETIKSSLSANEQAFRDLTMGYAMLLEIGSDDLNADARSALATAAATTLNGGVTKVTALTAELGNRMNRVSAADTALKQQKDIVTIQLASLEEIDLTEASSRVAALKTQLEVSYRVTGLIREISILDYL